MTNQSKRRSVIHLRKTPSQQRSQETVAVVLEATARILERGGFAAFNTNAVAACAGVSIGSLYQYFPNKEALLSGLIEREMEPLLAAREQIARVCRCRAALRLYIEKSIDHQMRRPRLARLLDEAEGREAFACQVSASRSQLGEALVAVLKLPGAPAIADLQLAAMDVLVVIRSLVDAAGQREEQKSAALMNRVEGAVWGYLRISAKVLTSRPIPESR